MQFALNDFERFAVFVIILAIAFDFCDYTLTLFIYRAGECDEPFCLATLLEYALSRQQRSDYNADSRHIDTVDCEEGE